MECGSFPSLVRRDGKTFETVTQSLPDLIRQSAEQLADVDDPRFGAIFDRFADARVVLLGEAKSRHQ